MALDLAKIQTLEQAVQTAQLALDNALPANKDAALKALNDAQAALASAWTAYYNQVLPVADQLLGRAHSSDVVGLFPVALEAKLQASQHRLRLRVWPDTIAQSAHDPSLTALEQAAGQRYWVAEAAATSDADHLQAWRVLANQLGPQRAAWVVQTLTPTNQSALGPGVAPQFPTIQLVDPAHPFVPVASLLPDRWVVVGYRWGQRVLVHVGQPIARPLVIGLDTTPTESAGLHNADGTPIQLPPRMRWMVDFPTAVAAGMAMEIPVPSDLTQIDELYVFGIRDGDAAAGRTELEQLLAAHRYSRGLAFVPQGTPTNNSPTGGAGLPTIGDAITQTYTLERKARAYSAALRSNGKQAASVLGITPELLATAPLSGAVSRVYSEPDGFEPEIAHAMQTVLWMPTVGHFFEDLVGLDTARVEAMRTWFIESVRASGPVPALRVGAEPYGILPVTATSTFHPTAAEGADPKMVAFVDGMLKSFNANGPYFGPASSDPSSLLVLEGRPSTMGNMHFAPGTTGSSFWDQFTAQISNATHGAITSDWAKGALAQLRATAMTIPGVAKDQNITDATPLTITDAATATALAGLATARPDALLAATGGSILTRLARYGLLLEWARLARAACDAALQGTAFRDGAQAAAGSNRKLWIDLLLYAFNPVGTPPVPIDAPTGQKIVALVGSLDAPVRTCPGQPRFVAFRAALQLLSQVPVGTLEANGYAALSLGHGRLDAWQTALATARLTTLRKTTPLGVLIGGFGWMHDLRTADQLPAFTPEFIHAPSADQAAAAAVLRSSALRADRASSEHANIDLSSRRVRIAHELVDGVRNGLSLGELLGARVERQLEALGTSDAATLVTELRRAFPSGLASGVLDGLAFSEGPPQPDHDGSSVDPARLGAWRMANINPAFAGAANEVQDSLDALADALTAEGVYQLVRGNPAGALAELDGIVRGEVPPRLQVTETPLTGTRVSHRVVAAVPAGQAAPGWATVHTPRADGDPILDAWCGWLLGPAAATVINVDGTLAGASSSVAIGLDRLGIAAIDVVAASANGGAELRARVLAAARAAQPQLTAANVRTDVTWKDLVRLCARMARLIARAEPLDASTLSPPSAAVGGGTPGGGDLPTRVAAAKKRLEALRDALVPAGASATLLREAAGFGILLADASFGDTLSASNQAALASAVRGRLSAAAARVEPREQLRALVGDGILGIVAVTAPDATVLATATTPPQSSFAVDAAGCASWLESMSRVRPALTRLGDVLAIAEISGRTASPALRIAQAPFVANDPWIALGWTNPRTKDNALGRLSLVLHVPAGIDATQPLGGFIVDAWTETVPLPRRDTGMAVRHNGPDTRAPQTMLLAVAPDLTVPAWTTDALVATLRDTLSGAVMRQGFLDIFAPSIAHVGQRSDSAGISFTLEQGT